MTTITSEELAHGLSDVLDRVRRGGEHFEIEQDGRPIAVLAPGKPSAQFTVGDFIALLERLPHPDDAFADDLAAIHASQPVAEAPELSFC